MGDMSWRIWWEDMGHSVDVHSILGRYIVYDVENTYMGFFQNSVWGDMMSGEGRGI